MAIANNGVLVEITEDLSKENINATMVEEITEKVVRTRREFSHSFKLDGLERLNPNENELNTPKEVMGETQILIAQNALTTNKHIGLMELITVE